MKQKTGVILTIALVIFDFISPFLADYCLFLWSSITGTVGQESLDATGLARMIIFSITTGISIIIIVAIWREVKRGK